MVNICIRWTTRIDEGGSLNYDERGGRTTTVMKQGTVTNGIGFRVFRFLVGMREEKKETREEKRSSKMTCEGSHELWW